MTSSPLRPDASLKEQLDWYKTQYAQLETDLSDFQASSKDLEEQLEKDVETAEKNERKWKEQVEKLNFEVEEWKAKHKQSKAEANTAQNALQKEITTMRESNRTMQLRLRDTEVMNDDYERQARNTESSLEDLESKYNAAIERGVLLEEEIKLSEQDREALRIEAQRLRDDLGDLKVESDITHEKLRLAEETAEVLRMRKPNTLAVEHLRARSPGSEASALTPLSPTVSTPGKSDTASEVQTPPSPPLSDTPANGKPDVRTPVPFSRSSLAPESATPRPSLPGPRTQSKHLRGPSVASSTGTATSDTKSMRPPTSRPRPSRPSAAQPDKLPRSESLYQIRGLIGRMQKIEERVHSARSKLPAPNNTTPRNSPRAGSALSGDIPSSVTMRRSIKRPSGSTASSVVNGNEDAASSETHNRRESHVKRLSYGIPRPSSVATSRSDVLDRPPSALDRPPSAASVGRPSSSLRPQSRTGARTDLGNYSAGASDAAGTTTQRPRSSVGGNYATANGTARPHRPSTSVSELRRAAAAESEDAKYQPTSRRTTLDKSGLPTPTGLPRRQSGGIPTLTAKAVGKRASNTFTQGGEEGGGAAAGGGEMRPPPRKRPTDVGETY